MKNDTNDGEGFRSWKFSVRRFRLENRGRCGTTGPDVGPPPKLRGKGAVLHNASRKKCVRERDESSLTQGQVAEQAARGDSARGRAAYLVQQQVRRVLFEAYRHADVVDAEEAAASERQIHPGPSLLNSERWHPADGPATVVLLFLRFSASGWAQPRKVAGPGSRGLFPCAGGGREKSAERGFSPRFSLRCLPKMRATLVTRMRCAQTTHVPAATADRVLSTADGVPRNSCWPVRSRLSTRRVDEEQKERGNREERRTRIRRRESDCNSDNARATPRERPLVTYRLAIGSRRVVWFTGYAYRGVRKCTPSRFLRRFRLRCI